MNAYPFPETLLVRAIAMRALGSGWQSIEDTFKLEGHKAPNGQPWHNANIAARVLADPRGSALRKRSFKRKRKYSKKKRAKSFKCNIQLQPGNTEQTTKVKSQISHLESLGFTSNQIISILKTNSGS
jgi:hypothetical protein